MTEIPSTLLPFECVEPELGGQLDQLGQADIDPALAARLRGHLAMCDACRLDRALVRRLPESLGHRRALNGRTRLRRQLSGLGSLALAAGLALMVMLPPTPSGGDRLQRGDDDQQRFLRPVEGEVIAAGVMRLNWTPVEGASAYRVRVESTDGTYRWEETARGTTTQAPSATAASVAASLRAYVEPVPADLAPGGGIAVAFRTGSRGEVMRYRLAAAPTYARLLTAGGALALAAAVVLGFVKRR